MGKELEITSIERFNYQGDVYDICVEDEHNYVVNDISVHNSGAGSEICYLLGITNIDPISNKLIFERFLNPSRVSMPDIDIDIQSYTRKPGYLGKDILIESLTRDKFPFSGQIVNEMRCTTKVLVKKLFKSMGLSFFESNKVSTDSEISSKYLCESEYTGWIPREIPRLGFSYDARWQEIEKYIGFCYEYGASDDGDDDDVPIWNTSIHASGVIFYPSRDKNILPKNSQGVSYKGHDLESVGYIKYDLLSLDALNPINYFISKIEEDTGKKFDWEDTFDNDTWDVFCRADTDFVFQFSSPGMKRGLKVVKPRNIAKLAELNSLYRPGCIQAGIFEKYLRDDWTDEEKIVGNFLKQEFGEDHSYAMIFQEDIMKIVQKMAGFSLADADLIRRAIGKKDAKTMASYKSQFIDGFDVDSYGDIAETVWNTMESFCTYTFNKSHSVAYSCVAYWEAYLFTHYKNEYLEYLINKSNKKEVITYLSKDHEIVYPSLVTRNTEYVIDDSKIYLPTISILKDETPSSYLLSLDSDKNKMIVKFGILDSFCPDRKGLRDVFGSLDKKKLSKLDDDHIEWLKDSNTIFELLKKLSGLGFIDYKKNGSTVNIDVIRPRSKKNFTLHTTAVRSVVEFNCLEDIRAYGLPRPSYCDELPDIPIDIIDERLKFADDPDIDKRRYLDIIVRALPEISKINNPNSELKAVFRESDFSKWPRASLAFSNTIADFKVGKNIAGKVKALDKNQVVFANIKVNFYLNKEGEIAWSFELENIERIPEFI